MSKELRGYQQAAIDASLKRLSEGIKAQIIVLPTGAGKTLTAVKLIEQGGFNSVLFCTDTEELCEQSALAFLREKFDDSLCNHINEVGFIDYVRKGGMFAGIGYKVGLIKADVFEPEGNIVIASLQTLHRRLDKLDTNQYDCIIVDECHILGAQTYIKGINHFTPKLLLGITATPQRGDNISLSDVFDEIVYEYPLIDAIKDGYLVELDAIRVKTNVSLDKVKSKGGDLNEKDLSNEINTLARNNLIAQKYLQYCNGTQAIGFAVDIKHAIDLSEAFVAHGIKSAAVSSNEELTGDRSQKIKDFKEGRVDVLFNVGILTKGFDSPPTSTIIMARPTKSLTVYLQAVGRGTRPLPGVIDGYSYAQDRVRAIKESNKKKCVILDIVDNTTRHNLVNAWELDGGKEIEERTFTTQEKKEKLLENRKSVYLQHTRDKDERVSLLKIPKLKVIKSEKWQEDASEAQLKWIYSLDYPKDQHYTKAMASEIIGQQPASKSRVEEMARYGYDVKSKTVITNNDYSAVMMEVYKNKTKPNYKK